jgi:hypothetical protein
MPSVLNARIVLGSLAVAAAIFFAWQHFHSPPHQTELSVTDGSRLRISCAGVSMVPDRGWAVQRFELGQPAPGKPELCSPTLIRRDGSITALVVPKDAAPLRQQADAFLGKLRVEALHEEEVAAASGLQVVHASGVSPESGDAGPVRHIQLDLFFLLNREGRMAVVYDAGLPEQNGQFVIWFVKTVQLD